MTRPGTVITERDQAPPRTPPTDTGVAFVVTQAEKGPTTPTLIQSMKDFSRVYGARVSYSIGWDALETFFAEGGAKAYVLRRVGPAPVAATLILKDASNVDTLTITASSVGAWANNLKIAVEVVSSTFSLVVTDATTNLELARGGPFADKASAVTWAAATGLIVATSLAPSTNPKVLAATALAGGTDDRTNINESTLQAFVDAQLPRSLGPGQLAYPGQTTTTVCTALATHAAARGRVAILDLADTSDVSTLKTAAGNVRTLGTVARSAACFANWVKIGGVVPGTTRTVPPSAFVLGRIAAVDAAANPNVPAAGEQGRLITALSLTQSYGDDVLDGLTDASVNTIASVYGEARIFGFRTAVDKSLSPLHWQLSNVRLDMAIRTRADAIAQRYVFKVMDGQGALFAQFGAELAAMLQDYTRAGALYGNDDLPAYRVDTGATVNTPDSIADGKIRAVLSVRRSPMAELAEIEIVKSAVNAAI